MKFVISFTIVSLIVSCENNARKMDITFLLPNGSKCIEIINVDSIAFKEAYMFRELVNNRPVLIAHNYLTVLDDSLASPMPLLAAYDITDIHWNDGQCFFSSDSTIFYSENTGRIHPIICLDGEINSFNVSESRIIFPLDSLLLEYRFGDNEVTCIANIHETISCVHDIESVLFFASGRDLYLSNEDQIYRIYESKEPISSFAVHPSGGIFLGTQKGVSYLTPDYQLLEIVSTPAKDLSIIGDDLYIIFEDNSSVKITDVSNYQHLVEDSSISD